MKKLYIIIYITLFLVLTSNAVAVEQRAEQGIAETAKAIVGTNLNQVLIEILSGVKDAGKEVYGASKDAIHKSVDFVVEQTPDVVTQFLRWKFYRALTFIVLYSVVVGFILFFASMMRKYQRENKGQQTDEVAIATCFKWVFSVAACILIILGIGSHIFEMVKIKTAPKVYVIEYVVDVLQSTSTSRPNR